MRVEALLFDLGGVVVDIDFNRALRHWASISSLSLEQLQSAFGFDLAYEQHERGEITASEYFESLRTSLKLKGSDTQIALGWNSIFVEEIRAAVEAVKKARQYFPCHAFSNSNTMHQSVWRAAFPDVVAVFDQVFVSSDLGLRKPERAAFEVVAGKIGVAPEAILFFDDTLENVTGAQRAGLQARHVESTQDIREALLEQGCVV